MRGRKPTPAATAIATGNPSHRPIRPEPRPDATAPPVPLWLSPAAFRVWQANAHGLAKAGCLTAIDGDAFARYCNAMARYLEAEVELEANGPVIDGPKGGKVKSPWLAVQKEAAELAGRLGAEFGMSPASRTRVSVPAPDTLKPGDALKAFLGQSSSGSP